MEVPDKRKCLFLCFLEDTRALAIELEPKQFLRLFSLNLSLFLFLKSAFLFMFAVFSLYQQAFLHSQNFFSFITFLYREHLGHCHILLYHGFSSLSSTNNDLLSQYYLAVVFQLLASYVLDICELHAHNLLLLSCGASPGIGPQVVANIL